MNTVLRSKHNQRVAIQELLEMLAQNPAGLTTSEMSGTPRFHGGRTLANRQIAWLLRKSGQTKEMTLGNGMRTATLWQLNEPRRRGEAEGGAK